MSAGITLFFAAVDELHQIYFPDRVASMFDLLVDILGIAIALLVFNYLAKRKTLI